MGFPKSNDRHAVVELPLSGEDPIGDLGLVDQAVVYGVQREFEAVGDA